MFTKTLLLLLGAVALVEGSVDEDDFDLDNSGGLNREERSHYLYAMKQNFLNKWDTNGNGKIDEWELTYLVDQNGGSTSGRTNFGGFGNEKETRRRGSKFEEAMEGRKNRKTVEEIMDEDSSDSDEEDIRRR